MLTSQRHDEYLKREMGLLQAACENLHEDNTDGQARDQIRQFMLLAFNVNAEAEVDELKDVLQFSKLKNAQVKCIKKAKFALTDAIYDEIIKCVKQAIIKDLKGVPPKQKTQCLRQIVKRVEDMRPVLVLKQALTFNALGEKDPADQQECIIGVGDESSEEEKDSFFNVVGGLK